MCDDLADAVAYLLATAVWRPSVLELDDGLEGGYRWADLAEIAGRQLRRRVRTVAIPRSMLWPAAAVAGARGVRHWVARPGCPRASYASCSIADWVARPSPRLALARLVAAHDL